MMSLFSSFDFLIFYWSFFLFFFFFISYFNKSFILDSSEGGLMILNSFKYFFYSLSPLQFNKFSLSLKLSVFFLILGFNLISVFSFIFPLTSQFGPLFFFSFNLWLNLILFNFFKNFKGFSSHFTPDGAPLSLVFLLFAIELVSNMIRPITLAVRLVANILAGHLLMILLSKMVFIFPPFFIFYLLLNVVELFVGLIQSYIFCTMIVLYFSEVH